MPIDDIFQEYVRMRGNGLETKEALKALRLIKSRRLTFKKTLTYGLLAPIVKRKTASQRFFAMLAVAY